MTRYTIRNTVRAYGAVDQTWTSKEEAQKAAVQMSAMTGGHYVVEECNQ